MKTKLLAVALLGALLLSTVVTPSTTLANQAADTPAVVGQADRLFLPLISSETSDADTLAVAGTTREGGSFEGTFSIDEFAVEGDQIVAKGPLTGNVYDAAGNPIDTVNESIAWPVSDITSREAGHLSAAQVVVCDILQLDLGPLHLDLLGLVIDLDEVHLDIDAEQAPGNLLGNLLCAVVHLLDPPESPLDQIVGLLNQILGILKGLG